MFVMKGITNSPPCFTKNAKILNVSSFLVKDACGVGKVYWRRERAHDKTRVRVVRVVCTAGAFTGFVNNVKRE